jgi:hypothetical protein
VKKAFGILAAVVGGFISIVVAKELVNTAVAPSQTGVASQVEEGFKRAVAQIRPTLPRKMDESTTLEDVSSNGMVLTYFYKFDSANYELQPNYMRTAQKTTTSLVCKAEDMRDAMKVGAVYEYRYRDANAKLLGGFVVTSADCV